MIVDSLLEVRREPPKLSGIFQTHTYGHGELRGQLSANAFSVDDKMQRLKKRNEETKQKKRMKKETVTGQVEQDACGRDDEDVRASESERASDRECEKNETLSTCAAAPSSSSNIIRSNFERRLNFELTVKRTVPVVLRYYNYNM